MVIIQIVACRNNLETAYLWIIETAKTTDVHKFSEHCVVSFLPLHQNHLNVLNSVPIKCWKHLLTMVELRLNISVHSEQIFASLYYLNFTSTDDGINMYFQWPAKRKPQL